MAAGYPHHLPGSSLLSPHGCRAAPPERGALILSRWCLALSAILAAGAIVIAHGAVAREVTTPVVVSAALFAGALALAGWGQWRIEQRLAQALALVESDPATGCLNRRGFGGVLDGLLAVDGRTKRDVAMLALDLDHFKQINDRHGHIVGDAVLSDVAAMLVDEASDEGCVARLGGEEFAILLPDADAEIAGAFAERLMARLRSATFASVLTHPVTMSIGISAEQVSTTLDTVSLRARADEALYAAKRAGRDQVLLWAPGVRSNKTPTVASIAVPPRSRGSRSTLSA